ncbi:hypothetical protein ACVWZL_003354 [Bradyrhizobium sp. GM2.4]
MSKKHAKSRNERVGHVLKLENWSFDYSFDVGDGRFARGPYSEGRQILLNVKIEKPASPKVKAGLVRLFASDGLVGADEKPRQNFLDSETGKIKPVGRVWHSGKEYQAVLFFPRDMLSPLLTMLTAKKYRYLILEVDQSTSEMAIQGFTLAERHGDEPELAASWDDV